MKNIRALKNFIAGSFLTLLIVVSLSNIFQLLFAGIFNVGFVYSLDPFNLFFIITDNSTLIANFIIYFSPILLLVIYSESAQFILRKTPVGNMRFILIINIITLNIYILVYFFYVAFGLILKSSMNNDMSNLLLSIKASYKGEIIFSIFLILLFFQLTKKTITEISKYIQK